MKTTTAPVIALLNAARAATDAVIYRANAYDFALVSGTTLYYTDIDKPFSYDSGGGSHSYVANSVLVSGLKYKASIGLQADTQEITISAASTDLVGSVSFLQALENGIFDGCIVTRSMVFFSTALGGTVTGGVVMFKGVIGEIGEIGRTSAKITVNSKLVFLDIDMPRHLYQPTCVHTLYDVGCALNPATFSTTGAVGAASTSSLINWASAAAVYQQGKIAFTSGANNGLTATIKTVVVGVSVTLVYPVPFTPSPGDTFTVYQGCDHTSSTCKNQFNNLVNFRGFPVVPPSQTAY